MANYPKVDPTKLTIAEKEAVAAHARQGGSMTNMKWTLLNDLPSFKAYMSWYDLREGLLRFLTPFEFNVFAYAISTGNDCLVCSTFFRKILLDSGKDPDHLILSPREKLLFGLGRAIDKNPHAINPGLYAELDKNFSEKEALQLLAFAGIMVATNLFVTIAQVDLDEGLFPYQKKEGKKHE
jgi:alkylhydroperoxidase family enzyme